MAKKSIFAEIAKDTKRAREMAARRAAKKALTSVIRYIRQYYAIRAKDLREAYRVRYEFTGTTVKVSIVAYEKKPFPLIKYASPKQTKKGVKVTVRKGARELREHAFIATMPSGHKGIFLRKTKKSLPIREMYSASPRQLLSMTGATEHVQKVFFDEFEKEHDRLLGL